MIKLQEFEKLHPAIKICRRYIHFHNEKIKVNLAVQVLAIVLMMYFMQQLIGS